MSDQLLHHTTKTARLAVLSLFFATANFSSSVFAAENGIAANEPVLMQAPAPVREAMILAPEHAIALPSAEQAQLPPSAAIPPQETTGENDYPSLSALPEENVWQRIRAGFAMNELNSPLIKRHEKWYASHPDYMLRMSERAQHYLYYITEEVNRRGMPSEIALLPVIESAFNPGANSVARASGIWQFIPSTGKHFGMEQNWWYDGRRDVIGATNGALDYLQKLHDQFGDWELALAAYNCGENCIARAQARNLRQHKPTDFAHLNIPRETRNYVPKLLAVKNIISDPARYGIVLHDIPNRPYFDVVTTTKPMDVKLAAELADISMEEFLALNPGHNRPVILHDNGEVILLPVDKVATFRDNLEKNNQRLVSWRAYKTTKGETFAEVASQFDIRLDQLRAANGLSKYATQSNGQTLLVPAKEADASEEFSPFNMHATAVQEMSGFSYAVHKGDTISSLARRFHVSQASLVAMNHGSKRLSIGHRFTILPGSSAVRYASKRSPQRRSSAQSKIKRASIKHSERLASNL
ncbi:MAG: transglycosylase SLT domain-containing protein [Sideroxydans sp.]|nr:transglycosylase SLT domain-containing protein [Sideroxydans sp.]